MQSTKPVRKRSNRSAEAAKGAVNSETTARVRTVNGLPRAGAKAMQVATDGIPRPLSRRHVCWYVEESPLTRGN